MVQETIALFGGTGRTGRYVVPYALDQGYKVRLLARTPSKVDIQHPNLTVIQGDFANLDAVQKTIQGATYVISCSGAPQDPSNYPTDMMLNFVKTLYPILEAETSVKVFLYQSGGFAAAPGQSLPFVTWLVRQLFGRLWGITPMIHDNENVAQYMSSQPSRFQFIITRPGRLEEDPNSEMELVSEHVSWPMSAITYKALGRYTVDAVKDATLYGKYPFTVPKK
jgi:nucleoside-diphosphate-sugar epimerase